MDFIVADVSTAASDHPSYSRRNSDVVEEINRDDTIYKQSIVKQECKAIGWNEISSADDDDDNDEDDELEDDEDDQTLSEHKESINEKSEDDHDREFHELSSSAEHKGRVWTKEEDEILLNLYKEKGSQWASMCSALPRWSRTQIKTRFKSLHRAGKRMWKRSEDELLLSKCGNMKKVDWSKIAHMFPGRTKNSLKIHFKQLIETNNGSKRSNHVQQQTLVPPAPGSPRQALIDNEEFLLLASKKQQPASQDDSLATPEPAIKKCRMEETDSQTLEIQIRPPSRSCSISPMMDVNTIRIPSSQSHQMWNQLNSQKSLVQNQASSTFAFMDPISASNQIHSSAQFNQLPRYHHNLLQQQPQQQYPFYKQSMPFPLMSQYNQQNSYMGHGVSLSSAPYGHIYRDGANMLNTLMFQQNSNPQINVQRL